MILTFGQEDIYFRVFVGDIKCNFLRKDFIMKYECHWDYRNHNLMVKCVHTRGDTEAHCRVRSVEEIVIPPRHKAVVKSKVIPSTNIKEGILVPMMKFVNAHELVVGQALVNTESSVVFVHVFNPGDKAFCVKDNTQIASATLVNYVSEELPNISVCNIKYRKELNF
jgi:dUTPase